MLQQQQHLFNTSTLGQSSTMNRNLMAAEEIRVDCVQMTNNGRYVVTGSNCGPPQVWDLKSGELVKVMKGDEFSSTDLHLANGDTLLVGQVAELEPVDVVDGNRVHQRRLQVWDFETGKPIEMSRTETCTASCMMSDGERMLLGRTDRFGGGTTIIIWDILANEPVRQIKCDSSVGFADHISYLNVTKDSRYVIAGFQNTYDGTANYVTFDLASADINASGMRVSSLDADVDVTTLLNDKEAVTGTRKGELIVWSVKTGKQLRSLGGGAMCHNGEVKDVVVSKDGQLLVSASTDGTIKVWDIDSESLLHTLTGHRDEVWCCTLSPDNELVGSGSKDGTIRLWKVSDGTSVAAIDAGMTVFKVLLSNNKKTVVALADKGGARKLIMLRVVRSTATIDRRNQIVRA
ncbi:hypothetical protein HELRODRAFT_96420 [Helobdella robusta]|uniref:Anaphase-promoting complex subunit 4 WD40 domain-containing protein n=1 Tax=Helobdella robusta TaxID=6412 RepID=T1G9C0_HELRO|nr:hypothetical protein HELRODRAFT_96420 [Helobdella robusta]ESN91770.1 hypothetical protein HELRODRAFT_96420 [Helobdella robusta]